VAAHDLHYIANFIPARVGGVRKIDGSILVTSEEKAVEAVFRNPFSNWFSMTQPKNDR